MEQLFDIIFLAICLFFAIRAFFRGFLVEFFSLLAFVGSFFISLKVGPAVWNVMQRIFDPIPIYLSAIPYIIVFLASYIIIKILEKQLSKLVNLILLTGLNRILGLLFGLVEGAIIILVMVYILTNQQIITSIDFESFFMQSRILEYFNSMRDYILKTVG